MNRDRLSNAATQTDRDQQFAGEAGVYFEQSSGSILEKLNDFPRFVSRQSLSLFLAKHELFKRVMEVHGSVVECGVFAGGGLFTWAQLSAIYEPYNHGRRVLGFDSFNGFPSLSPEDGEAEQDQHRRVGGYCFDRIDELQAGAALQDLNRPIGHIPRIELVAGDAAETIPRYVEQNPHLVVSLLYLDFDLFEPTVAALSTLLPRMPRGAVIGFDELNQKQWPGETRAVMEVVGIDKLRIRRFPFTPGLSYAVIE
ncbi:TylF/MycF/NovP-related O-methyltransferase [Halochromatium salexigens]|uniref:dTDP-6-deoxy-L-hexose 3-O-methyltransferase n=1 Tax=Halochromatium salexigens TaxID=49447 RepID=A0AAJ0UEG7_HALSE|nr:TylF/MycF/NovP-related O-methyltransferase [Halochromatium salexigens]MBK5929949.1 dTDP-6-deoxy-L-hexose 3-O-methyltransferase [Halochromatium salexigens]